MTCLCLIRHYILNFGGSSDDGQSYWDRELLGKTSVGGMVLVTLPALVGVLFGKEEFTLTGIVGKCTGRVSHLAFTPIRN